MYVYIYAPDHTMLVGQSFFLKHTMLKVFLFNRTLLLRCMNVPNICLPRVTYYICKAALRPVYTFVTAYD